MREQGITQGLPWDSIATQDEAPILTAEVQPAYTYGLKAIERPQSPGTNSVIVSLLLAVLLLTSLNFRDCQEVFVTLLENCRNVRRRGSLFDNHPYGENRTIAVLFVLTALCEGLLIATHTSATTTLAVSACTAVAAAYLAAQLVAYRVMAYTFIDTEGAQLFFSGFTATQSLLGIALTVPTVLALFVPAAAPALFALAVLLYMIARLTFIIKGFRLFYDGFYSLSYFILYLCTLEVAPLWVIVRLMDL